MRGDARINMIGEGDHDVVRCFIGGVGLRHLGQEMLEVSRHPWKVGLLRRPKPPIPVVHTRLQPAVADLSRQIAHFARACRGALFTHRERIVNQQYVLSRLRATAIALFLSSLTYSPSISP